MSSENTEEALLDTYQKSYRMQTVGTDGNTVRTSVPREVIEREARKHGLTVDEFVTKFKLVWLYDGFPGIYARFERIESQE